MNSQVEDNSNLTDNSLSPALCAATEKIENSANSANLAADNRPLRTYTQLPEDASGLVGVREVGVGPWPGGPENYPTGAQYDPELLENGDRRNVADRYRYWTVDAIVADLDKTRVPLHLAIENLEHDLNIGSLVRTANAFNLAGVHIVGKRRWNRRGAMVTDRYIHIYHHPTPQDLAEWAKSEGLPLLAIDILEGSKPLETADLPSPAVLILGQEGPGLSPELLAVADHVYHVTQLGSTRSINVAAAGAIAMWAWMKQHSPAAKENC